MNSTIIARDIVAQKLAISTTVLVRYESLGLIRAVDDGSVTGYDPAQIRRLWTIVSFQRDLGVNLAGVELILHLFDHLSEIHREVDRLAIDLGDILEEDHRDPEYESSFDDYEA
jgi:MerR family transcriptional regulator, heat shock protein HspR